MASEPSKAPAGKPFDEIGAQIVTLLVENARLSVRAIARRVHMSPTAVTERIERLEKLGVIVGYHAEIDFAAIGWGIEAVVGMETRQGEDLHQMVNQLMRHAEVITVDILTGRWDLLIHVRAPSQQSLHDFVVQALPSIPGFERSETMVCWEVHRRSVAPDIRTYFASQDD